MSSENYHKIVESLSIRLIRCEHLSVPIPFAIKDFEEEEDTLIFLKKGSLKLENKTVKEGSALLIPANRPTNLQFGESADQLLSMDEFIFKRNEFFSEPEEKGVTEFTRISFETRIFDTVNFFYTLEIPAFDLNDPTLNKLIYDVTVEQEQENVGFQRAASVRTELLVIQILRYILENKLFEEKVATNSNYFKDPRLIELFNYIKSNLAGDLSNKQLSEVAGVSEDYVGQYFKALTGINPQDYIEYQRMEHAVELLRTTKISIREVGKACGYKDTAYFCRRFKMMYNIPAGKMRKKETLINV